MEICDNFTLEEFVEIVDTNNVNEKPFITLIIIMETLCIHPFSIQH